jgi:hypothetical protein
MMIVPAREVWVVLLVVVLGVCASGCEFNCLTQSWCGDGTPPTHTLYQHALIHPVNIRNGVVDFDDDA